MPLVDLEELAIYQSIPSSGNPLHNAAICMNSTRLATDFTYTALMSAHYRGNFQKYQTLIYPTKKAIWGNIDFPLHFLYVLATQILAFFSGIYNF